MQSSPIDVNGFEDIRPFNDGEIKGALEGLLGDPLFYKMMKWVYPDLGKNVIQSMMKQISSVDQFQQEFGAPVFKVVAQKTTSGLTFSNMELLEKGKPYLFLSNHRDIILDSALLNVSLMEKGYDTTQIAIGDNLLKTPFVKNLVRANKNFIVNRNINAKEMFFYSLRLSNYIRKTITEDKVSIWIAHREGRSKDGDDRTASGLLKMFTLSSNQQIEDAFLELNIIPMCVSYEYDPCDILKANELAHVRLHGSYDKKPGEDFMSMMRGLTGHKGRVNISVGNSFDKTIEEMRFIQHKNEKIVHLANAVDAEMHRIYRLWPNNFIAYDMLNGSRDYRDRYTNIQKIAFANYIRGNVIRLGLNRRKLGLPREGFSKSVRDILLEMYANPVVNKRKVTSDLELHL